MSIRTVGAVLALSALALAGCGAAAPADTGAAEVAPARPEQDPQARGRMAAADADQLRIWLVLYRYACPVAARKVEALGYQCPELPGLAEADCYGALIKGCEVDADLDGAIESEDCDDADPARSPWGDEICGDGLDNDCDGADVACPSLDLSAADARFTGGAAYDWAGWAVSGLGDLNGDGYDDAGVGAPWEDSAGGSAGRVYLVTGGAAVGGASYALEDSAASLTGESAGDQAGGALAGLGDIDGDGYDDLIVGASQSDGGAGAAYVVLGGAELGGGRSLADADQWISGAAAGDYAGWSVAGAGDVNGDGYPDLLIGARGVNTSASDAGAAYLIYGPGGDMDLSAADVQLSGESAGAQAGYALAGVGDVDGDGLADLLIGAPYEGAAGANAGAAYLVSGAVSGVSDLGVADARLLGQAAGDYAGYSVAGAGDVNGDGYPDLLVGAFESDAGGLDAGAAYLVLGPLSGDRDLSAADAVIVGEAEGDRAGCAVAGVGDVDGDGLDDLAVGAYHHSGGAHYDGAGYLFLGPVSGSLSTAMAALSAAGEAESDQAGYALAGAGDMDGDGLGDLLLGAHGRDGASADAGAAYLLLGVSR